MMLVERILLVDVKLKELIVNRAPEVFVPAIFRNALVFFARPIAVW
jgi:NhaP-type Na+/H+ and K+/H+ antiporter